jgi:hypothetical protein
MMNSQPDRPAAEPPQAINFHGGAIIDAKGKEIPITEAMIQQALVGAIERPHLLEVRSSEPCAR